MTEPLAKARLPAYKLTIDFGALGHKQSSARVTDLYQAEGLVGRLVVAVVNFAPRRIAGFVSEVLVLGAQTDGGVVLLGPERAVSPGERIF
ncbi:MAG: tRNA-binding protein [Solidesulfovibrio sp. DCME]|uniref:tRNA-binding protein n=1 Tax=Solidesulfovibrio sp. DCME TaxID=3447380 RepID=UPI003D11AF05